MGLVPAKIRLVLANEIPSKKREGRRAQHCFIYENVIEELAKKGCQIEYSEETFRKYLRSLRVLKNGKTPSGYIIQRLHQAQEWSGKNWSKVVAV